jgi:hypothetical protein
MNFSGVKLIVFTCLIGVLFLVSPGQTHTPSQPPATPFVDGEQLAYEGKLSKVIQGIAVADLNFTLQKVPDSGDFIIKAEAKSKGSLLKLFRFSFLQELQSNVDSDGFRAIRTVKHDVQKERVRNSEAVFDYGERRVTYIETDPNEPMKAPRRIASEIDNVSQDLISSLYSLRLMPLRLFACRSATRVLFMTSRSASPHVRGRKRSLERAGVTVSSLRFLAAVG